MILVLLLVVVAAWPVTAAAQGYTCTDKDGGLVMGQGAPPPELKCSAKDGLAPGSRGTSGSSGSQSKEYWEQRAREGDAQRLRERQASQAQERQLGFGEAVEACKWVADAAQPFRADPFQVRVTRPGRVEMVGTPGANYAFSECMQQKGHPVE